MATATATATATGHTEARYTYNVLQPMDAAVMPADGWVLMRKNDVVSLFAKFDATNAVEKWKVQTTSEGKDELDAPLFEASDSPPGANFSEVKKGIWEYVCDGDQITLCDIFLPHDTPSGPSIIPFAKHNLDEKLGDMLDDYHGIGNRFLNADQSWAFLPGEPIVPKNADESYEHLIQNAPAGSLYHTVLLEIRYKRAMEADDEGKKGHGSLYYEVLAHVAAASLMSTKGGNTYDQIPHACVTTCVLYCYITTVRRFPAVVTPLWYGKFIPHKKTYHAFIVDGYYDNDAGTVNRAYTDAEYGEYIYTKVFLADTEHDAEKEKNDLATQDIKVLKETEIREDTWSSLKGPKTLNVLHTDFRTEFHAGEMYFTTFSYTARFASVVDVWSRSVIERGRVVPFHNQIDGFGLNFEPWRFAILQPNKKNLGVAFGLFSRATPPQIFAVDCCPTSPADCVYSKKDGRVVGRLPATAEISKAKNKSILQEIIQTKPEEGATNTNTYVAWNDFDASAAASVDPLAHASAPPYAPFGSPSGAPFGAPAPPSASSAAPPSAPPSASSSALLSVPSLPIQRLIEAGQQREIRKAVELLSPRAPRGHHDGSRSRHRSRRAHSRAHLRSRSHSQSHSRSHSRSRSRSHSRRIPKSRYS